MESPVATTQENPSSLMPAIDQLKSEQNFNLAVAAGISAAIGGAILWAIVTVTTQSELGLMAIAVGYLVGQAIKKTGKGIDKKFGYLGAACGFLGCTLGNVFSAIAFYANVQHVGFMDVINSLDMNSLTRLMTRFSQPMDIVFYGIGIYEGYKFSFKYRLVKKPALVSPNPKN